MSRVFVDTSALLAFLDADDPRHEATRSVFQALADDELVTHGYVVAESIAVTRRRFGVDGAIALVDQVSLVVIEREAIDMVLALDPTSPPSASPSCRNP